MSAAAVSNTSSYGIQLPIGAKIDVIVIHDRDLIKTIKIAQTKIGDTIDLTKNLGIKKVPLVEAAVQFAFEEGDTYFVKASYNQKDMHCMANPTVSNLVYNGLSLCNGYFQADKGNLTLDFGFFILETGVKVKQAEMLDSRSREKFQPMLQLRATQLWIKKNKAKLLCKAALHQVSL